MAILMHVIIALASIGFTSFVFIAPSRTRLKISYGLIAATVGSGTYLVLSRQAHMLQTCISGLFYLALMSFAILAAQYRLAKATAKNHDHKSNY